jgi:hypothetical protein
MKESQFGFEYSWSDLRPVRALAVTVVVVQICGGLLGLFFAPQLKVFLRLWIGGALATFPAFLAGLAIQANLHPGSIGENLVMVRRLGLIAALLSLAGAFLPYLDFE